MPALSPADLVPAVVASFTVGAVARLHLFDLDALAPRSAGRPSSITSNSTSGRPHAGAR